MISVCNEQKPTAKAFFELFLNLQCVVLQDASILLHQGRKHLLFSLPVFATELFRTYQAELIAKVMVEAACRCPYQYIGVLVFGVH